MLELEIQRNETAGKRPPQEFNIVGGVLDAILGKQSNPARAPLIWQNGFYGSSRRRHVTVPTHFYAENSPLFLHPQVLNRVIECIYIPKDVVASYRAAAS